MITVSPVAGSPPHARGRRAQRRLRPVDPGITPACAGKTSDRARTAASAPDHPRMRGEDSMTLCMAADLGGSPPHARGRPVHMSPASSAARITPACAGKTAWSVSWRTAIPDHPRMRGEDKLRYTDREAGEGSPPHARGRRIARHPMGRRRRITPACAGKTDSPETPPRDLADHPRMRGEDFGARPGMAQRTGSPPHARGRRRHPL